MTSRDVDLQGTVHGINANIYDSMLQKNSVDINKLCKVLTHRRAKSRIQYTLLHAISVTQVESDSFCLNKCSTCNFTMTRNVEKSLQVNLDIGASKCFQFSGDQGASTQLRSAMEHVAGKAKELTKARVKDDPPPPFRKHKMQSVSKFVDWDPKKYATDGKASRDKRTEKHHIRVFGMQKLGMVEYRKTHGRGGSNDK